VENDKHCFDTLQHKVRIYANPIAKYGQNSQSLCVNGNEFNFRDSSTAINGSMTKYIWNYGNGSSEVASQNSDYVYPDTGNYSVRLFVENSLGCADSIRRNLRVRPNPITKFGADISLQCLHTNETEFTDSSISNQVDPAFIYAWDFGDTTYSTAKNPKKTYKSHGVRTVRLISTNAALCPDTAYHNIEIKPEPNTRFAINQPAQCVNNNSFTFDDTSYIAQVGGSYTVRWKFADGFTSADTIVNRRIITPGLQRVRLVLTSQFNCQDSLDRTIRLYDKPKGEISYLSKDSCLSTSVRLKAINKIGTGLRSARWDFSDGTSLIGETVSKKFDSSGIKTIRLIVESSTSCYDTSTHSIRIYNNPKSNFSPNIFASCLSGNTFEFYDSAIAKSGTMANIIWDFNDGVRSNLSPSAKASHTFTTARKFNVKHIAVKSYG
jgi:PKD repeat protein